MLLSQQRLKEEKNTHAAERYAAGAGAGAAAAAGWPWKHGVRRNLQSRVIRKQ